MWRLNLSSSALWQPVSIFSDVTRRNPVAANQSPACSYRRLLPADRIVCPVSTQRGMPCMLADIIITIIISSSLIFNTNWIMAVILRMRGAPSLTPGSLFISPNVILVLAHVHEHQLWFIHKLTAELSSQIQHCHDVLIRLVTMIHFSDGTPTSPLLHWTSHSR